ncbi:hypothetical protein BCD48_42865 [Pseudofrankia sp. BMG5.36]|nr:hypothetical protein BCD48_42865 [Pseudofrankia sp. BMG5.36]
MTGCPGSFETALHVYHSSPFSEMVTEDELRFINRGRVRFVPVDEILDQASEDRWYPAPLSPEGAKLLRLTQRPTALDPDMFRDVYERYEVPAIRQLIAGCADYRRNYVGSTDSFCFATPELQAEIGAHGLVA